MNPITTYRRWHYKNTALLITSIVLFTLFTDSPAVQWVVHSLIGLGYLGAFIVGIFFVSTFTVVPAGYVIFELAKTMNPFALAFFAGLGGTIGDALLFSFLRDRVFEELKPVFMKLGGNAIKRLFHTPFFGWLGPFIGAVIIASPFPDEIGIGLLGVSKLTTKQFIVIAYFLDTLGILIIALTSRALS